MAKTYKITYKIEPYTRLKELKFHSKVTYPLYVHVTYRRKTLVFKSYYFDLLSSPKYIIEAGSLWKGPSLSDVEKLENDLLKFLIESQKDNFSLESFKSQYDYFALDICSNMEDDFIFYLFLFFQDKGRPSFASMFRDGAHFNVAYDIVRDMKALLVPEVYREVLQNAFDHSPPYLPLYGFIDKYKRWPLMVLSVWEWESGNTQADFSAYLKDYYPEQNEKEIIKEINEYIEKMKNKLESSKAGEKKEGGPKTDDLG